MQMIRRVGILLLLQALVLTSNIVAQTVRMRVYLTDSADLKLAFDSIERLTFTQPSPPDHDVVNIFTRALVPYPYSNETSQIDSLVFVANSIRAFTFGSSFQRPAFPIFGKIPLDSIAFQRFKGDSNIHQLTSLGWKYWDCDVQDSTTGLIGCAAWNGNRIYRSEPLGFFSLDSSNRPMHDSTYCPMLYSGLWFVLNASATKFLSVSTRYSDVSFGRLYESELASGKFAPVEGLADSAISLARYMNEDSIIYYSYGSYDPITNPTPADAGYYIYSKSSKKSAQVFAHINLMGPDEMINGFDYCAAANKLLVPVVDSFKRPILIQVDLKTKSQDTIRPNVDPASPYRWGLWTRYDKSGGRILIDRYPRFTFQYNPGLVGSEVGVYQIGNKTFTHIGTDPVQGSNWVTVFSDWSPDESMIVFCTAKVVAEPPGTIAGFEVCLRPLP
jgi:hypothetical protein